MSVILLLLGILIAGAGIVTIGIGIPINESAVGQTLIIAGAAGLVGGPVLVALAAALAQLKAIAKALQGRPSRQAAADGARTAEAAPAEPRAVEAAPAASIDVSASAIERLRSTMPRPDRVVTNGEEVPLSPNGGQPADPVAKPRPGATVEAIREPRLDFLFRSRSPRPRHQAESFDMMWPKRGQHRAPDQSKTDEVGRQLAPGGEEKRIGPQPAPAPGQESRQVPILKSGVVDGMAYTLYADGSIEAQLPHGTVRFGSIAELRAHIENNS